VRFFKHLTFMPKKKIAQPIPEVLNDVTSFVPVIGKNKDKILSKNETDFNKKIKRIESLKAELSQINVQIDGARQRIITDLFPLIAQVKEKQKKYLLLLDAAYESGFFKKKDRETLMEHILEICDSMVQGQAMPEEEASEDDEIVKIKNKYDTLFYSAEEKEMIDNTAKEMLGKLFGIDIDLDELRQDPEGYFERKQKSIEEEANSSQEQYANRKKTKKQLEKEQKLDEDKKTLAKDIRTIYTALAKELHPDLEKDEQERLRKTEMMKRVTVAYENNDLFELLRLQLEYQIQHERIESLVEEQLKRYNQLLQTQINELESAKREIIGWGSPIAPIYQKFCGKSPQMADRAFRQEKAGIQQAIDELQDSINRHTDYNELKEYLKQVRKEQKQRDSEFDFGSFSKGW
jgi:hypothetical protein